GIRRRHHLLPHEVVKPWFRTRNYQLNRHTSSLWCRNTRFRIAATALDFNGCRKWGDLKWLQAKKRKKMIELVSADADGYRIRNTLGAACNIAAAYEFNTLMTRYVVGPILHDDLNLP